MPHKKGVGNNNNNNMKLFQIRNNNNNNMKLFQIVKELDNRANSLLARYHTMKNTAFKELLQFYTMQILNSDNQEWCNKYAHINIARCLRALTGLNVDISGITDLLKALTTKIHNSNAILNGQAIGNALYGLKNMNSDSETVKALLRELTTKIHNSNAILNEQAIGIALYGLQNMNSDSETVKNLLRELTTKIHNSNVILSGQEISNALYGLQNMNSDSETVKNLLRELTIKIHNSNAILNEQEIANALYGLQNMNPDSEIVINIINVVELKKPQFVQEHRFQIMIATSYINIDTSAKFLTEERYKYIFKKSIPHNSNFINEYTQYLLSMHLSDGVLDLHNSDHKSAQFLLNKIPINNVGKIIFGRASHSRNKNNIMKKIVERWCNKNNLKYVAFGLGGAYTLNAYDNQKMDLDAHYEHNPYDNQKMDLDAHQEHNADHKRKLSFPDVVNYEPQRKRRKLNENLKIKGLKSTEEGIRLVKANMIYGDTIEELTDSNNRIVIDPIEVGDQNPTSANCFYLVNSYHINNNFKGKIKYTFISSEDNYVHAVYCITYQNYFNLYPLSKELQLNIKNTISVKAYEQPFDHSPLTTTSEIKQTLARIDMLSESQQLKNHDYNGKKFQPHKTNNEPINVATLSILDNCISILKAYMGSYIENQDRSIIFTNLDVSPYIVSIIMTYQNNQSNYKLGIVFLVSDLVYKVYKGANNYYDAFFASLTMSCNFAVSFLFPIENIDISEIVVPIKTFANAKDLLYNVVPKFFETVIQDISDCLQSSGEYTRHYDEDASYFQL